MDRVRAQMRGFLFDVGKMSLFDGLDGLHRTQVTLDNVGDRIRGPFLGKKTIIRKRRNLN